MSFKEGITNIFHYVRDLNEETLRKDISHILGLVKIEEKEGKKEFSVESTQRPSELDNVWQGTLLSQAIAITRSYSTAPVHTRENLLLQFAKSNDFGPLHELMATLRQRNVSGGAPAGSAYTPGEP